MKKTQAQMKALVAEYGSLALWIHIGVFCIVLTAFALAIQTGFRPESATASGGTLLAAYLATKATSPLRIVFTLAATPLLARGLRKRPPEPDT